MYKISYEGYNNKKGAAFSLGAQVIKNKPITEAQLKTIINTAIEFISCFALTRIEIQVEALPEKEKVPEPIIAPVSTNIVI